MREIAGFMLRLEPKALRRLGAQGSTFLFRVWGGVSGREMSPP